jgi:hypothetical protein
MDCHRLQDFPVAEEHLAVIELKATKDMNS